MKIAILILIGLGALMAQGVLVQLGLPAYATPQLLLLVVVYLSFSDISVQGSLAAFLLGVMLDLSTAILVGPWAGAFIVVYGGLVLLSQRLFIESGIVACFVSFFATIVSGAFYTLLSQQGDILVWSHAAQLFGQACATAIVAPCVISSLSHRFKRRSASLPGRMSQPSAI